ncbi:MAG: hypothetical protein AAGA57_07265 [Planctomycetota bacterium]
MPDFRDRKPEGSSIRDEDLLADAIPIPDDSVADLPSPVAPPAPKADKVRLDDDSLDPIEMASASNSSTRIHRFGERDRRPDNWKRKSNKTGDGATHVKTFVAKLRMEAVEHLDKQVNQWLDENPEYEVKFAQTTVGELRGKTLEPALFLTVWV